MSRVNSPSESISFPPITSAARQRRFQFHLGTAVLLSLVCGVFMFKNAAPSVDGIPIGMMDDCDGSLQKHFGSRVDVWRRFISYGWPAPFLRESGYVVDQPGPTVWSREWEKTRLPSAPWDNWNRYNSWDTGAIIVDCLVLLLILTATGAAVEYLLRRREARKV
jgi:hypothetical protein